MKIKENFKDARGSIIDILTNTDIDAVTLINSNSGAVRANHYHKKTIQWTYVLEGELEYWFKNYGSNIVKSQKITPGSMVCSEILVAHAFKSITKSQILVLTKGPRNGDNYEQDTFRLEVPLV